MNEKQKTLDYIVDTVVECCAMRVHDAPSMTRSDVLGSSRKTNLCMTRCILCDMIISAGYSTETVALLLSRTEACIRDILKQGQLYNETSHAYRVAHADAHRRCKDRGLI